MKVLCVDDDSVLRDMLAAYLRRSAFDVETAPDGLAALKLVSANLSKFDLIITDNQMPQMNGITLVKTLRQSGFQGKIVFFSSSVPPDVAEELTQSWVDAVVEKGRSVSELTAALNRVLSRDAREQ